MMRTIDIFETFKRLCSDGSISTFTNDEMTFITRLSTYTDIIKMISKNGHTYIFKYINDEQWTLYYGRAAVDFERSFKHEQDQ